MKKPTETTMKFGSELTISLLSVLFSLHVGATEYFVDENRPDDSGPGTSKATAFKTIQAAVSQTDATIVTVYPGRYTRGSADTVDYYGFPVCVYIDKAITLRSAEGRDKTFIVGQHAEANGGVGEGGVRCVTVSAAETVIDGFTICDGATAESGSSRFGGGINITDNLAVYVNDCTISNCVAVRGGAVYWGRYERCLFVENKLSGSSTIGSIAMRGYFRNCAFYKNGGSGFIYANGFLNCAFVENGAQIFSTHNSGNDVKVYNCVFSGNKTGANIAVANYSFSNCVFDVSQDKVGGINKSKCIYDANSDQFIDPAAGDWRVCRGSESATAGDAAWFSMLDSSFGSRPFVDYIGNTITATEGDVCAGPCQTVLNPSAQVSISATRGGGVTVTGAKIGANTVKTGKRVDVTAVETNRLFIGWRVNGVMAPSASMTYSYEVTGLEDSEVSIEAVYSDAWYVDAVNGNDVDNDGCTPETPKKTLAAILSVPGLLEGEVVHAAPGEYNTGTMSHAETDTVLSRACVPKGVTLLADKGPEKTFIIGGPATADAANDYGLGSNAVRCVWLSADAKISGFTLTGGRTHSITGDNGIGSAIYGSSYPSCYAENCIVTGNVAYSASLVACHAVNCRIFDNHATFRRSVGYNIILSGCVVDRNTGDYPLEYFYGVRNCTIGADNSKPALYYRRTASVDNPVVVNTLVLASGNGAVYSDVAATNSVFVTGCGVNTSLLGACIVTNEAALQVDSNLVPVIGHNVAIDRADASLHDTELCGDRDVYGLQRVANGAMDIGAAEASWLDRYSHDLGGRGVVVTNATPLVVETAAGNVSIPDGRLDLEWRNPQATTLKHTVPVSVTGTGTLTVMLGGEVLGTVTRSDGDVVLEFSSALPANGMSFVYVPGEDDDGAAVLGVLKQLVGFHVILR